MCELRDVGMRATGTAREGRLGNAVLASKSNFDKSQRGKLEHTSDGKKCIVRWSDKNVVTCMSNFDNVYSTATVQRHVKGNVDFRRKDKDTTAAHDLQLHCGHGRG